MGCTQCKREQWLIRSLMRLFPAMRCPDIQSACTITFWGCIKHPCCALGRESCDTVRIPWADTIQDETHLCCVHPVRLHALATIFASVIRKRRPLNPDPRPVPPIDSVLSQLAAKCASHTLLCIRSNMLGQQAVMGPSRRRSTPERQTV